MIYEFNCEYCGKPARREYIRKHKVKFCSTECCKAAQRERDRVLRESRRPFSDRPLVPHSVCRKCKWGRIHNEGMMSCVYLEHHEHTRTYLHPEGLTADCKEFEPRRKLRNGDK